MDYLSWLLPESFSTFGQDIDRLYYIVLWITAIAFVLTEAVLVYFLVRYRHKEGRKAHHFHGNYALEVVWTGGTAAIVIGLAIASTGVWHHVKRDVPDDALEVIVTAKQFEWNVTYPGADGRLGTDDDFERRNAQLCGLGHYRMQGQLTVHAAADYPGWVQGAMAEAAQ